MKRELDHLVLPVESLEQARRRLSALGFTVAANASHPFGTRNACVFLEDGHYLEPLAIGDTHVYAAQSKTGNTFVYRDDLFRKRRGQEGFSGIIAKAFDAEADHRSFVETNISGGAPLSFSRPVTLPDGQISEASFRLAFAGGDEASDVFFATCQRLSELSVARSDLTRHGNGVIGIREVVLSAERPLDFAPVVERVFGISGKVGGAGDVSFKTGAVVLRIVAPSLAQQMFGSAQQKNTTRLCGEAIILSVSDLAVTEALLAANGVAHMRNGARLLVQRAPGQGAILAFEE